jgi:hypothetical protein
MAGSRTWLDGRLLCLPDVNMFCIQSVEAAERHGQEWQGGRSMQKGDVKLFWQVTQGWRVWPGGMVIPVAVLDSCPRESLTVWGTPCSCARPRRCSALCPILSAQWCAFVTNRLPAAAAPACSWVARAKAPVRGTMCTNVTFLSDQERLATPPKWATMC